MHSTCFIHNHYVWQDGQRIIPIPQVGKVRPRKVRGLAWGHVASKKWNPGLLTPDQVLFKSRSERATQERHVVSWLRLSLGFICMRIGVYGTVWIQTHLPTLCVFVCVCGVLHSGWGLFNCVLRVGPSLNYFNSWICLHLRSQKSCILLSAFKHFWWKVEI